MKTHSILSIFIILFLFTSCREETNTNYKSQIVGKWKLKQNDPSVKVEGYNEYLSNGMARSTALILFTDGPKYELDILGKWSITDNKLHLEITKSNLPDLMPVGTKWTETIISLNAKELKTKDDIDGEEETLIRVNQTK